MQTLPKIVIVGGGAGGMEIATKLGRKLGKKQKAQITLVDFADSHVWKPLLHEVATGALDVGVDALNYRSHAASHGYQFQQGAMTGLDREKKLITLAPITNAAGEQLLPERQLSYDYLVFAVGSVANDFNIPGVKEHCKFLDTTQDAMAIRQQLLDRFMRYAGEHKLEEKIKIAVVGAGATGIEMSAEMHFAVSQLQGYGFNITKDLLEITLIEAADRVLPAVTKQGISEAVNRELTNLGINVMLNTRVTQVDANLIHTQEGKTIDTDMVIWASGIKAPDFLSNIDGLETTKSNQVLTKQNMQSTLDPNIFAIGDCAACPQEDGSWVPPRGQAARQMALMTADNIIAMVKGKPAEKIYIYKDLGSLVNLSRFHTVGNLMSFMGGGLFVEGTIARFVYTSLYRRHLIELHGFFKGTLLLIAKRFTGMIHPHLKLH